MQFVAGIKRRTEPLKQASWMIRQLTDWDWPPPNQDPSFPEGIHSERSIFPSGPINGMRPGQVFCPKGIPQRGPPGTFGEADSVGTSVGGMFVYTVNVVDLATSWTEQRAVWGKGYLGVKNALQNIEQTLPFPLRGFSQRDPFGDCDNGAEFLNWHLHRYLCKRKRPVEYTRSRPFSGR